MKKWRDPFEHVLGVDPITLRHAEWMIESQNIYEWCSPRRLNSQDDLKPLRGREWLQLIRETPRNRCLRCALWFITGSNQSVEFRLFDFRPYAPAASITRPAAADRYDENTTKEEACGGSVIVNDDCSVRVHYTFGT